MQAWDRGFSLAEACIALALLTATMIMGATVFQATFGYGRKMETRLRAAQVARNQVVRIRSWLRDPDNFRNFLACPFLDQEFDGFRVQAALSKLETASPNTSLEAGYSVPRSMRDSLLRLDLTVTNEQTDYFVSSLVGAPRRALSTTQPIVIETLPSALARDEMVELEVRLKDSDGRDIEDIFFQWSVRPVDGVATLAEVSRDGRRATVQNRARRRDGTAIWTGGRCRVGAGTVYGGEEIWFFSEPIVLNQ